MFIMFSMILHLVDVFHNLNHDFAKEVQLIVIISPQKLFCYSIAKLHSWAFVFDCWLAHSKQQGNSAYRLIEQYMYSFNWKGADRDFELLWSEINKD